MEKRRGRSFRSKPNKTNIILLALIFGAAIGVAGIVVSEYADASFRSVEDIEKASS